MPVGAGLCSEGVDGSEPLEPVGDGVEAPEDVGLLVEPEDDEEVGVPDGVEEVELGVVDVGLPLVGDGIFWSPCPLPPAGRSTGRPPGRRAVQNQLGAWLVSHSYEPRPGALLSRVAGTAAGAGTATRPARACRR